MIVKLMCPGSCKCSGVLFFFRIHVLLFVLLNSYVDPVYKDYGDKVARCIAWVHDQQCHQIYGPTKNRQALPFLLLFVYMYSVVRVGEQRWQLQILKEAESLTS
ncbi:hypothetical protein Bca4012_094702 [Brassica carinata]|uniref:(rape) hypothetical protein n=1 Tax=Brassica napus TaxID=3708 RepID=A0A816UND6_BRANA|nr:unnamed protein product [Brassica napus]